MDAMKLAALVVCAAVCALILRRLRPEMGAVFSITAGILVLLLALPLIQQVMAGLSALANSGGVHDSYMARLLKAAGVSLLMDFAAQTCRDAGEEALAMKAELAGRIMLLSLALPFMQALLGHMLSLSP